MLRSLQAESDSSQITLAEARSGPIEFEANIRGNQSKRTQTSICH